jgi:hypothetical protein
MAVTPRERRTRGGRHIGISRRVRAAISRGFWSSATTVTMAVVAQRAPSVEVRVEPLELRREADAHDLAEAVEHDADVAARRGLALGGKNAGSGMGDPRSAR